MSPLDLIPAPYRTLATIVGVIIVAGIIAGAGFVAGVKSTTAFYQPKVAKAEARATEFEAAYAHLAATTAQQNDAIIDLQKIGEARQRAADLALDTARKQSADARAQATKIIALRPPAGLDPCRAASGSFDAELQQERAIDAAS